METVARVSGHIVNAWSHTHTHADSKDTYVSYCGGLFANFARHEKQLKLQKIYVVRSHKPDTHTFLLAQSNETNVHKMPNVLL